VPGGLFASTLKETAAQFGKLIGVIRTPINEVATVIASAVAEQGATIQEIARDIQEAAEGTQTVTSDIIDAITGVGNSRGKCWPRVFQSAFVSTATDWLGLPRLASRFELLRLCELRRFAAQTVPYSGGVVPAGNPPPLI
jgi:hypothetical protein